MEQGAFVFESGSEKATEEFGGALASVLPMGTVIALCGTLGAGKTRLVQVIATGFGVPREEVVSPTFVLCHEYQGTRTVYHWDAYRIKNADELRELGIEELFATEAVTIIEWADRVAEILPEEYLRVDIEVTGEGSRRFVVRAVGERFQAVIEEARGAVMRQH